MGLPFGLLKTGLGIASASADFAAREEARQNTGRELLRSSRLEEANAADAEARGFLLGGRARMAGSEVIARQRLAYTASGVDAAVGTPADVAAGTRMLSELEAQTTQNNAVRAALGHRETSRQYFQQYLDLDTQRRADQGRRDLAIASSVFSMASGGGGSLLGGGE